MKDEEERKRRKGMGDPYANYSMVVEGIVIVFSLVIVAYSVYYFLALGPIMSSLSFGAATVASLVAAVLLLVAAAATEGGILGLTYSIETISEAIVIFMIIVILAAGIALLVYREQFIHVKTNDIHTTLQSTILTYTLAVFHECCSVDNEAPVNCGEIGIYPCYENEATFNKFLAEAPCGLLKLNGLVSSSDPASCGNQEVISFVGEFMNFLNGQTTSYGGVLIAFSTILLILSVGVSVCIYLTSTDDQRGYSNDWEFGLDEREGDRVLHTENPDYQARTVKGSKRKVKKKKKSLRQTREQELKENVETSEGPIEIEEVEENDKIV